MRTRRNPDTDRKTMLRLQEEISAHNIFAESYQQMHALLGEEEQRAAELGETPAEVTMRCSSTAERYSRRCNKPSVEEVAAIFIGGDGPRQ